MPQEYPTDVESTADTDGEAARDASGDRVLPGAVLGLAYIPDFVAEDLRFWFVPSRAEAREVYHELVGGAADSWASYYSKKGWNFVHGGADTPREGPFRVEPESLVLEILDPGRFRAPKPVFRAEASGPELPLVSLQKRRPLNPWKPTYLRSLEFIKKYEWPHPVPRGVQAAIWEAEECGEVPGSVSWKNAEALLLRHDEPEVRATLADVFYNRPEDFPLASQVYLRVLGQLGAEGFAKVLELAEHPISRKRVAVARALGEPGMGRSLDPAESRARRVEILRTLLDDEDPYVRSAALRSIARTGLAEGEDEGEHVRAYLDDDNIAHRVWAAQALQAVDDEQRKFLLGLVKEDPRPLVDLGELGEVLDELDMVDAVPYLIQRLKDSRREISMDAAEALERLTGVGSDLAVEESDEARRGAIKAYTRWWDEKKRERREQRKR